MKKYLLLLLAILPIFLASCSSDNDDSMALKGTTWECNDGEDGIKTLVFSKKDFLYTEKSEEDTKSIKGSYTYDPPLITFTLLNKDTNKEETFTGSINKDKLSIGELVYTKKK